MDFGEDCALSSVDASVVDEVEEGAVLEMDVAAAVGATC